MARRDLPAVRDYDEMMMELQRRFNNMFRGLGFRFFEPEIARWPTLSRWQEITVDVRDQDDEVLVAADLPGVDKEDIAVRLPDPKILEISIDHREERKEEKEDYYLHERSFRSGTRTVFLPSAVTDKGVSSSFKNGVLELRLKKTEESRGKKIPIE